MSDWNDLREMVEKCDKCELCRERNKVVFGAGDPDADVLFVGEGPGRDEDLQGKPFVGAAGKILDEMLDGIGLNREEVFIGNIVKCRPPNNRDPKPEEIEACKGYLMAQIAFIKPKVICTLGRHSMTTLIRPGMKISEQHGRALKERGMLFLPIYHPAAVLHNRSQDFKDRLAGDFAKLKEILDSGYFES
ncbi:MAG TPA: uracil-DNA glycosylase [bacterium]|mgnify:CR=1 FL=1|nr:uracil-DNA glycosylase [bacterium]